MFACESVQFALAKVRLVSAPDVLNDTGYQQLLAEDEHLRALHGPREGGREVFHEAVDGLTAWETVPEDSQPLRAPSALHAALEVHDHLVPDYRGSEHVRLRPELARQTQFHFAIALYLMPERGPGLPIPGGHLVASSRSALQHATDDCKSSPQVLLHAAQSPSTLIAPLHNGV